MSHSCADAQAGHKDGQQRQQQRYAGLRLQTDIVLVAAPSQTVSKQIG